MRNPSYFVIVLCILVLAGCGKTQRALGPPFDPGYRYNGRDVLVYVYRPFLYYITRAKAPAVIVDGKPVVIVRNGGFTRLFLRPGKHTVELRHSPYYSQAESKYSFVLPQNARRSYIRITSPDNHYKEEQSFPENAAYSLALVESPAGKGQEAAAYPYERHDFYAAFNTEADALEELKGCKFLSQDQDAAQQP